MSLLVLLKVCLTANHIYIYIFFKWSHEKHTCRLWQTNKFPCWNNIVYRLYSMWLYLLNSQKSLIGYLKQTKVYNYLVQFYMIFILCSVWISLAYYTVLYVEYTTLLYKCWYVQSVGDVQMRQWQFYPVLPNPKNEESAWILTYSVIITKRNTWRENL